MKILPLLLCLSLPAIATADPGVSVTATSAQGLDLRWSPSLTPSERSELLENPAFAAGEPLMVAGLVAAGTGIGLLVAGLAGNSPELTTAGAIVWPVGATIHVVGLGLFTSATKPYFRAQREAQGPGLHIPGPLPR